MTPAIGRIFADRFELVRELGRGSMGSVWLANHSTLRVRCAVKFISSDSQVDPSFRTRFEFEARAIAQLQSPHVVRILDYAVVDDVPYIAMEYLEGEDLSVRLSRVGKLDAPTTCRIVFQVARGLTKAHTARLVHRDIKPENIFLATRDDEPETVKLLDFGVAKSCAFPTKGTRTQAGMLVGTPAYMSPEQVRGTREIDHRSDLWSLAVVAYQCLTGRLPFESEALGDLFAQIMYEPMPVPTTVAPWLSPEFDTWWTRAAARSVDHRFSSARELAVALAEALAIPGLTSELEGTGRWLHLPLPSCPPIATSEDSKPALASTRAPLTQSLRGAREPMRSRSIGAALAVGAFAGFGLSGSPAGPTAATARRVEILAPAVRWVGQPVASDAMPTLLVEQAPRAPTVLVTDPPAAPPHPVGQPSPSARAPTPSSAHTHHRNPPPSKVLDNVDFGI